MLQLITGSGISQYLELLEQTGNEYKYQPYLDIDANRLYFAGKPIDSHITVKKSSTTDYIPNHSYIFMDETGAEYELNEVKITDITDDYSMILRDTETQTDAPNILNGLMSVEDKFILDCIAKALGVVVTYEFYANVNHISDRKNGDLETMQDVDVYKDEDTDAWYYDYEPFKYTVTTAAGDKEQITQPAGSEEVSDEVVRVKSIHFDYVSDNINTRYDGGELADDLTTKFDVGGVKSGTSVASLETKTVSEVLSQLLFYDETPHKICDASASIHFVFDENFPDTLEVGANYPTLNNFGYNFIPETWGWSNDVSSQVYYTMNPEPVKVEYYFHDIDNACNAIKTFVDDPDDPECECNVVLVDSNDYRDAITNTTDKHEKYVIIEGSQNYFSGIIYFDAGENPLDSNGNAYDASGNLYADVSVGQIDAYNFLYLKAPIVGGWKVYSNASRSSLDSLWSEKLVNPEEFLGNDEIVETSAFTKDGGKLYLQWPRRTASDEHFYVYVADGYSIESANGAHDATCEEYSAKLDVTFDSSLVITNKQNAKGVFNKFEISKQAGITTACVVFKKEETEE